MRGLAADVLLAHVDDALQPQHGAGGGGCDAVLPRAGLGDDALLAHVLGEEGLAEGVVNLVGAGVGEVFPFQVYLCAAEVAGKILGVVKGGRPADVAVEQTGKAGLEVLVGLDGVVGFFELGNGGHERLGDELAAEVAEAAAVVGKCCRGLCRHRYSVCPWILAAIAWSRRGG